MVIGPRETLFFQVFVRPSIHLSVTLSPRKQLGDRNILPPNPTPLPRTRPNIANSMTDGQTDRWQMDGLALTHS